MGSAKREEEETLNKLAIDDARQCPGCFQVVAILLAVFSLSHGYVRWL
jgi:hypothetical protein